MNLYSLNKTGGATTGTPTPPMTETEIIPECTLENGTVLRDVPVAYQTWGTLNEAGDNVIVVCHALTGNTEVDDWWGGLLGSGKALDTDRYFVVIANVIGSPYGTVSPITRNPATGKPYGGNFPDITIRDTVALHKQLLERLGVRQVAFAIGGSMGGMQVLEWAFYGDFVRGIVPLATSGRHSAWCIGLSETQRQAIYADPLWQGGHYDPENPPAQGLSVARMMAMVSYRSHGSFQTRFGRQPAPESSDASFSAESYLRYQGNKLVERFDANCYVSITKQMDTHDVARGRGEYAEVLGQLEQPALVIGVDSDVLYPLEEQEELAALLPNAELAVLQSPHGHDAFLIELETLNELVQSWRISTIDPFVALAA